MSAPERRLKATSGFYKNYVKKFYEDAHRAKVEKRPVAWVSSTFPVETLQAMDIMPVWPENYASVCAARQVSVELCERAEREGFSRDLCSYSRCVLGSLFGYEKELPEGGLPKPDLCGPIAGFRAVSSTRIIMRWFLRSWISIPTYRLTSPGWCTTT